MRGRSGADHKRSSLVAAALVLLARSAFAACGGASPNLIPASNGYTDVAACVTAAVDGDTITIPAGGGTVTWSTKLTIPNTKGLKLIGPGESSLTITNGLSGTIRLIEITLAAANTRTRLSGFTLDDNLLDGSGDGESIYITGLGVDAFRVDHLTITNIRKRGIAQQATSGGALSGLYDHNTFKATGDFSAQGIEIIGAAPGDSTPYSRPFVQGTNDSTYIEDNTFTWDFQNDSCYDAYGGMRYVARFNTFTNCLIGHHGADSGGYRGVHTFEVYRNTMSNTLSNIRFFHNRAGVGRVFENTATGNYGTGFEADVYRVDGTDRPFPIWGSCDGSHAFDGNTSPTGYPCLDQTGWLFTDDTAAYHGTIKPLYAFKNTDDGVEVPMTVVAGSSSYVAANREYYNYNSGCTGGSGCATGVGYGTIANLPTTCTTGVGYWATDQGSWNALGADGVLYLCTSTNTWTLSYTPYTYPHPLQGVTSSAGTTFKRSRIALPGKP